MDTTEAPQIIEIATKSLTYTPFDIKWIPSSCKFVLIGQTPTARGTLQIIQLDQQSEGKLKQVREHISGPGYKTCTFGASSLENRSIAVGDFGGTLTIFDVETLKENFSVKAHEGIVNCVEGAGNTGYGPPELVTGCWS